MAFLSKLLTLATTMCLSITFSVSALFYNSEGIGSRWVGAKWGVFDHYIDDIWQRTTVSIYSYNNNGTVAEEMYYNVGTGIPEFSGKVTWQYDANDSCISELDCSWLESCSRWYTIYSTVANREANGRPISFIGTLYLYDYPILENNIDTYTKMISYRFFNENGRIIRDSTHCPSHVADNGYQEMYETKEYFRLTRYTYENGKRVGNTYDSTIEAAATYNFWRETVTYNNSGLPILQLTEYGYQLGALSNHTLDSLFYDGTRLTEKKRYEWNHKDSTWTPAYRWVYYTTTPPEIYSGVKHKGIRIGAGDIKVSAQSINNMMSITLTSSVLTKATLELFDLKGARISKVISNKKISAGSHTFSCKIPDAIGPIVYKLTTSQGTTSNLLMLK